MDKPARRTTAESQVKTLQIKIANFKSLLLKKKKKKWSATWKHLFSGKAVNQTFLRSSKPSERLQEKQGVSFKRREAQAWDPSLSCRRRLRAFQQSSFSIKRVKIRARTSSNKQKSPPSLAHRQQVSLPPPPASTPQELEAGSRAVQGNAAD